MPQSPDPIDVLSALDPLRAEAVAAVFDLYDPPVWLVTAAATAEPGSRRGGCVATLVTRASIVRALPRVLAGIARHHHTWGLIEASGRFAVHLLPAHRVEAAVALVSRFALASGHDTDKLAGLPDNRTPLGSPLIDGAMAWLDCQVEARLDTGDRTVYLAAVTSGSVVDGQPGPALTVQRLFEHLPAGLRARLNALYAHDGQLDTAAIRAWRAATI